MARRKQKIVPDSMAIRPTVGARVQVLCRLTPIGAVGARRTGEVTATSQGAQGDMFVVLFDGGYSEAFRGNDIRIGDVQLIAA